MKTDTIASLPWIKAAPLEDDSDSSSKTPSANAIRLAKGIRASEPTVEPVLPCLEKMPEGSELLRYAVPQVRYNHCLTLGIPEKHCPAPNVIAACPNLDGQGVVAFHARLNLKVNELIYPGRPTQDARSEWIRPIHRKWLYVFRDKHLVVELYAPTPSQWKKQSGTSRDFRGVDQYGEVCLDPGPDGGWYRYSLFLSPVKLTQSAVNYLLKDDHLEKAAVTVSHSQAMSVLLPDPFAWAAAAQERYHLPSVVNYQHFVTDSAIAAKCFVAQTLKSWCNENQDLRARLAIQPEEWLEAHELAKSELMWEARKAAAYLALCVDAVSFQAIQTACGDGDDATVSLGLQAFACVTQQLIATKEGTELARRLALRSDSLLAKHIFHSKDHPPAHKLDWQMHPRAWSAALAIASETFPAVSDDAAESTSPGEGTPRKEVETERGDERAPWDQRRLSLRTVNSEFDALPAQSEAWKRKANEALRSGPVRAKMQQYLENIGIPSAQPTTKNAPTKRLFDNLKNEERIGTGAASTLEHARIQKLYRRLETSPDVHHTFVETRYHKKAERLEHAFEPFESYLSQLKVSVGSVLEIANLCFAVAEYREERDRNKKSAKLLEAVGAGADMSEHILSLVKTLANEGGITRTLISSSAGIFGFVSNALEIENQREKLLEAWMGEYDYGKAFGHGMQMVGSATGAVASGLSFAAAFEAGAAAGAWAGWFGAFAGALIAGGYIVVKALQLTDKEQFAQRSFLGKIGIDPSNQGTPLRWSEELRLPNKDPLRETRALLMLLSAFEVSGSLSSGEAYICIRPGLLCQGSRFLVEIETSWTNWRTSRFRLDVDLEADRVTQITGPAKLKPGSRILRSEHNAVTAVVINAEDPTLPNDRPGQYQSVAAYVSLSLNRSVAIPDDLRKHVAGRIGFGSQYPSATSTDKEHWVALDRSEKGPKE